MLEIACFDLPSAETALQSVADRIEFCSAIEAGGLTPNIEEFQYLRKKYRKPIFVMIRPVGGEFVYSDKEFHQMKRSIIDFKNAGADGFVFGVLKPNNTVDAEKNTELLALAGSLPCTFHRAVDRTKDIESSVRLIAKLGFNAVLSSGGHSNAMDGRDMLRFLVENYSPQLDILIGGGVRSENIEDLKKSTHGKSFHSSAIPRYERFASEDEIKKLKNSIG